MIWSSSAPAARVARDIEQLMAAEWALEELHLAEPVAPVVEEQGPSAAELEERAREAALAEAAAEAERRVAEAYARGYEEGRRDGEEAEAARLRNAVLVAEDALDQIREGEMRWTGTIEENVCALAVAVARLIVGRELRDDPELVVELVRKALGDFPIDQPVRVRVNPQDLAAVESHGNEPGAAMLAATRGRDARWLPDARLAPGSCVVEGRDRIVDGRVDTALERIYRRLTYTNA